jgi:[acyl-carrier-protein] S-malonyltransferase
MKDVAYIFPGQGSQHVGMSRGLYDNYPSARAAFEEASDALGFDIAALSFNGPAEALDRTENTQPALLTASVAALRVLDEASGARPSCVAGHSLGEYTALVAAGALGFADAVRLVRLRGIFMQEAAPEGAGGMCAIIGLGLEDVAVACAEASSGGALAVPANINSPEQVVISGHRPAVERAAEIARKRGAKRAVMLQVSAPSHSPLMAPAAERLESELERAAFRASSPRVFTNVEARGESDPAALKDLLVRQLTSPVRWVETIRAMRAEGTSCVVEVGPGKVLSGLVRRIDRDILTLNLGEPGDLDNVLNALAGAGRG